MATHNLFHCKLVRQTINLKQHIFNLGSSLCDYQLLEQDEGQLKELLTKELSELFSGKS